MPPMTCIYYTFNIVFFLDRIPGLHHDNAKCDFPHASDLVLFIKETFGDAFCVGVAGYPDAHPESQTVDLDMKYLKQKVHS